MENYVNARRPVMFQGVDGLRQLTTLSEIETDELAVHIPSLVLEKEGDLAWVADPVFGGTPAPDGSGFLVSVARWNERFDAAGKLKL